MAYLQNAVSPYLYGTGTPLSGMIIPPVPDDGFPEIAINLNQTFLVETAAYIVPNISPNIEYAAYLLTFINSVPPPQRAQLFLDLPGSGENNITKAYNFFNTIPVSNEKTGGVIRVNLAGDGTPLSGINFYSEPTIKLLSTRGEYNITEVDFPWPYATSPNQPLNTNGIQTGALITFFTSDNFQLFSFDEPQTLRTRLNTLPV